MLLCNKNHVDIRTAVRQACEIHNNAINEFIALSASLHDFSNTQILQQVHKYIAALGVMMRGNIDWSQIDTRKYNQQISETLAH